MLNEKMIQALNKQIQEEFYSAYLYLGMSAYYENKGMKGFAHWLKMQHDEEAGHAMKIYDYLAEQGAKIELLSIEKPSFKEGSNVEIFEQILNHEKHITGCIYKLVEMAIEQKDYATHTFLQWFVMEQVEEESHASDLLDKLRMIQEQTGPLFMMDSLLAKRKGD